MFVINVSCSHCLYFYEDQRDFSTQYAAFLGVINIKRSNYINGLYFHSKLLKSSWSVIHKLKTHTLKDT